MYELGQLSKVLTQQLLGYAPLHFTYLDVILGTVFIMHQPRNGKPAPFIFFVREIDTTPIHGELSCWDIFRNVL